MLNLAGHRVARRICVVFGLLPWMISGCAAVSLFSHTHTHTHHHQYDSNGGEILSRLESIEHRIGSLEVDENPAPAPLWIPVE
jgi:hypothetical protein